MAMLVRQPDEDLTCVICLGVYDDPCICSDGWTYCRLCIAQWASANVETWKSPRTNEMIRQPAVIRSNEAVASAVLEAKRQVLAQRLGGCDLPLEALFAAATLTEKDRHVIQIQQLPEVLAAVNQIPWECLGARDASRHFAEALSIWHGCQSGLDELLAVTGAGAPRAMLERDASAFDQPLLRLGVIKDMLRCFMRMHTQTPSKEWLRLLQDTLVHLAGREAAVDCIEVSGKCFARNQRKASGIYVRSDGRASRAELFVCTETGALLEVEQHPQGAYGLLEGERARASAVITHLDGSSTIFKSRVKVPLVACWEHRRCIEDAFPDNSPIPFMGAISDTWPDWGDQHQLGLFESLPESLPEGFEYNTFTDPHRRRNEISCHKEVIQFLFENALGRSPTRSPKKRRACR